MLDDSELARDERIRREWLALWKSGFRNPNDRRVHLQRVNVSRQFFGSIAGRQIDKECELTLADEANKANKLDLATAIAKRLVAIAKPGSNVAMNAHLLLARNDYDIGQMDVALIHYRRLAAERVDASDLVCLSMCEIQAGNVDQAVAALEKALRLDPGNVTAHEMIANIFEVAQQGRASQHRAVIKALQPN